MGEMAETFRAFKAYKKAQKEEKMAVNVEKLDTLGIKMNEQSKGVFRMNTEDGAVMYYPSSNTWQHRGKVHRGDILGFKSWLIRKGFV